MFRRSILILSFAMLGGTFALAPAYATPRDKVANSKSVNRSTGQRVKSYIGNAALGFGANVGKGLVRVGASTVKKVSPELVTGLAVQIASGNEWAALAAMSAVAIVDLAVVGKTKTHMAQHAENGIRKVAAGIGKVKDKVEDGVYRIVGKKRAASRETAL